MQSGFLEIDVHGMTKAQAIAAIDARLRRADGAVYRLRIIHGFHGGTRIKEAIEDEFSYGRVEKVKNVRPGTNYGITELILR